MRRLRRVDWFALVVMTVCQVEVVAILGARLGVKQFRRIPTVSATADRFPPFGVAVLAWLAVHFWQRRWHSRKALP